MRTIRTKVYLFDELNEAAQQKAINELISINVDYDWWNSVYEDAKNIGLKLTSFDLDRNRHAKGEFILDASQVAENIISNHGEETSTYNSASLYLNAYEEAENTFCSGTDEDEYNCDAAKEEAETEFLNSLLEDYSIILQKECEYLQSDEAIKEAIIANEYEFTQDGKQF